MNKVRKALLALTLPLAITACTNVPNPDGSGNSTGNSKPNVAIQTPAGTPIQSAVTVSPNAQLKLKVSDTDGTVTAVAWTVTKGSTTVASGSFQGSDIKSSMELNLPTLSAGQYTLTVNVTDNGGATNSASITLNVDAASPTFTNVTFDGTPVQDGGTVTATVGKAYTLTATATDNSGAARVEIYQGSSLIARNTGTATVDVGSNTATSVTYTVVSSDSVGNSSSRTFTVKYEASSGETPAPRPVILINNTGAEPYNNVLSVSVSAGLAPGIGLKQLILEVTDAKGIVDTTTYTSTSENATFNIDTTKYPDGSLKLRAIAVDAKDQRGSSDAKTVQIANTVAPTITFIDPPAGSTVNGPTSVTIQVRQNNTDFTFTDNKVYVDVIDSRGQVVTTQPATVSAVNQGLWQATTNVDFNQTQYLNGNYTLKARTTVKLANETQTRSLTAATTVSNLSNPDEPPALVILTPSFFEPTGTARPVLTRKSAVAVQVSDSDPIAMLQLQFTCDEANKLPTQTCNTMAFQYNVPVGPAGVYTHIFNTGYLIDSQPFVPDGNYIMRVTAKDAAGNSNIKEMNVLVDRSRSGIEASDGTKLGGVIMNRYENSLSKYTPANASWIMDKATKNLTRVLTISTYADQISYSVDSQVPANTVLQNAVTFGKVGYYSYGYIVQDLVTGVIEYFPGNGVQVDVKQ